MKELDLNFLKSPVQVSQTLSMSSISYQSDDYRKGRNKRCNYAVKYLNTNITFEFEIIRYGKNFLLGDGF